MFERKQIGALLAVGLLAALWAAPSASARAVPADGILSPRLAALARPAVARLPDQRQARAIGLPADGPGSLERRGGRVVVEARFEGGLLARLGALRAAGARVLGASPRYQTATLAVRPGELRALDGVPGASAATETLAPVVAAACPAGAAVSQGDQQLRAAQARADFGLDGSGVTVGVISDSFATATGTATSAAGDVAAGDLPGAANPCGYTAPVGVLADYAPHDPQFEPNSTDEGRAMAQVVHDLAPGAKIDFATALGGELLFAQRIRQLAAAGAGVIVDDISYPGEPFFQDGPVAVAAAEAEAEGIPYFSSAGNDNLEDALGRDIASWETPAFRNTGKCPAKLGPPASDCLDFNPKPGQADDTFGITVEPESKLDIDLQWAEPRFGVRSDIDGYLLDKATGEPLEEVKGGTSDSTASGVPDEQLVWENKSAAPREVELAIDNCSGSCNPEATAGTEPRVKLILTENGEGVSETEYPQSTEGDVVGPTVYGHAGSPDVIAVGAVPFNNSSRVEFYSSHGPVAHYFGPVTSATPAAETPPETIAKPDISASDCVSTSFFLPIGGVSGFHFCGTSAAAPHAAAVAALARQANPSATPERILAGFSSTAAPVGSHFHDFTVGAGLLDAYAAIDEIALPPTVTFPGDAPLTRQRQPALAFAANRPVTFSCSLDGSPLAACTSPIRPGKPLADGGHLLTVEALDLSGRTGRASFAFTVDTRPPRTYFAAHPRRNVRTRKARVALRFRFGSDSPGSRFICRVDKGLFHFCAQAISRRFAPGLHTVRVKAEDPAGNVDHSAAVFHFRVRRIAPAR